MNIQRTNFEINTDITESKAKVIKSPTKPITIPTATRTESYESICSVSRFDPSKGDSSFDKKFFSSISSRIQTFSATPPSESILKYIAK